MYQRHSRAATAHNSQLFIIKRCRCSEFSAALDSAVRSNSETKLPVDRIVLLSRSCASGVKAKLSNPEVSFFMSLVSIASFECGRLLVLLHSRSIHGITTFSLRPPRMAVDLVSFAKASNGVDKPEEGA